MNNLDRVRIAYKKLKGDVYFDKTQLPLRDKITSFEDRNIEEKLKEIHDTLFQGNEWPEYERRVLDSVGVFVYPKKLKQCNDGTAIFNGDNTPIIMEKPQYFIDLSVEGHILSVLWVLAIGVELDKNSDENNPNGMYEHSYGNRLRKTLINPEWEDYTYSPNLFEPYFSQYESWRDVGLEQAKKRLNDKQDALILTLDFRSFYYSVDIGKERYDAILQELNLSDEVHRRLNDFVFKVIVKYSEVLRSLAVETPEWGIRERNILPLGFLPSGILANWVLTPFDDAIIRKWNPVYYGRYVDDIIIVDKVEKNSPLYKTARNREDNECLTAAFVINMFLVDSGILIPNDNTPVENDSRIIDKKEEHSSFKIDSNILCSPLNDIVIQKDKVKLFYFQTGSTMALLDCFQTKIAQNVSEFRLMPDLDTILTQNNYSEIFNLRNDESINKFRGITGVELDRFALSKFLGKYRKVSGMIKSKEENVFEKNLMQIMDERTLIENYAAWERLFEILVINDKHDLLLGLVLKIIDAIVRLVVPNDICTAQTKTHDGLLRTLHSAMCRVLALAWGDSINKAVMEISLKVNGLHNDSRFKRLSLNDFAYSAIQTTRKSYCETRMINKYILPLLIDCILPSLHEVETLEAKLYSLADSKLLINPQWYSSLTIGNSYLYYPYIVAPHELSFAMTCTELSERKVSIDPHNQHRAVEELFIGWNYPLSGQGNKVYSLDKVKTTEPITKHGINRKLFAVYIECRDREKHQQLRVAVGNARIDEKDFHRVLDRKPNRSYQRYQEFARMFDAAIKDGVELLVLPENYLPFDWLPVVSRMCANNQIALVTGIEHVVVTSRLEDPDSRGHVYNLTAVILPFEFDDYKFANISYHNKVEYSPLEKEQIEGHGYTLKCGDTYQLFCWRDVWFSVYCCFELASIQDRALFQSYSDITVAVEWNKDVPYFSNIIESLARDLHCYCIQANSSDYGDSRVVSPTETLVKDIIRTKGGKNNCILSDELNIKKLRDFQMLDYNLQSDDRSFKQTPPGFNKTILELKRDGGLFQRIFKDGLM